LNPGSPSSQERQSEARYRQISQKKRRTACPERKSNGSNIECAVIPNEVRDLAIEDWNGQTESA
jgi:hypothetical protein